MGNDKLAILLPHIVRWGLGLHHQQRAFLLIGLSIYSKHCIMQILYEYKNRKVYCTGRVTQSKSLR